MQEGGIKSNANVLIIDDLIATGGSASAAGELVEKCGAQVIENLFVIEIELYVFFNPFSPSSLFSIFPLNRKGQVTDSRIRSCGL